MKISEILKNKSLSLSFEVFPPKTDSSFESIKAATEEIASLSPSFMSVTYGAGGGTSRYTLEIAKNIKEKYSVPTLAHLTCVSSTRETVRQRIADIRDAGIENIMALRGDIPDGASDMPRDYRYAVELIRELRASGDGFCIGGACYPEVHPESVSEEQDIIHLREKVDAGLDFLTTQMFFDNDLFYGFLERARDAGINIPVIPGVMPITSANQIERAITLSGSYMPRRFLALVDKFGSDPAAMKQAGIAYATDQIIDLFASGVTNVHVYSMNKPDVARAILHNLSDILGK
nr:methylenetetrahydrofolate reductase [NAD(P)H] [Oscillospiraceae bacterium]